MRIGLVGNGKWGKKIKKKIIELGHSVKVIKKKDNLVDKLSNCNIIFVATPDDTHYKILKKIAILDKRTFCEKPVSRKLKDIKILNDFKKNKLYISDISNYYPNISLKKKNFFLREKFELRKNLFLTKRYDLLYRFAFHDFAYIYKKLGPLKFKKIKIIESKKILAFSLINKKMIFEFCYKTNSKKKNYSLNGISFYTNKDILKNMISNFINKKMNFKTNIDKVKYVSKLIDKVKKEIQNSRN
jgi:hypothetical protein|tara:strand:+ start:1032 stop:1760 length:729 start_codon:yes stop_codon:yes gene_type:complete